MRVVAARERERLLRVARAQAALDPRLLAEHQPQAPVHDLVVVDDEHAQLAVARAGGDPARVEVRSGQAAPPAARASCPGSRSPNSTIPPSWSASSAASLSPIPLWRAFPRTPSLITSSTSVSPSLTSRQTSTCVGRRACARCGRPRRARTARAARAPAGPRPPRSRACSVRCRSRCSLRSRSTSSSSVVLGLRRLARQRALQGAAQVEQRGLQLGRDPLARGRAQLDLAGEHELDPEQALDHGLVHLAREVHPLLQLAGLGLLVGRQAREGGERGGLAQRPQQVALGVAQRRAVGPAVGEDHAEPAAGGGHRRAHERRLADQVLELVRHALGHRARDLDHAVLDERLARHRHGLDGHLGVGEDLERDPVRAGGADAPARAVVAEDHGAVHVGEPAGGLAQAAVERVAGRVGLDAREQLDERLERVDADRRLLRDRVALHAVNATRPACGPPRRARTRAGRRATGGGRRTTSRCCCGLPVRVHQRRQAGRVHERDLGQVEHDGVAVMAQPGEQVDELRRGGDVQLPVDDERAVSAQVGDLRDLPARWTVACSCPGR